MGNLNISIKVPRLIVSPFCKYPTYRNGVVTVPPEMQSAAMSVLYEMADDVLPKSRYVERIIHRFKIANTFNRKPPKNTRK